MNKRYGEPSRFAPKAKPKNAKGTLRRIVKIYMRWGKTILLAMFLTAMSSVITVAIPYFVGKTFNYLNMSTRTVDSSMFLTLLMVIAALHLSNLIISSINGVLLCLKYLKS